MVVKGDNIYWWRIRLSEAASHDSWSLPLGGIPVSGANIGEWSYCSHGLPDRHDLLDREMEVGLAWSTGLFFCAPPGTTLLSHFNLFQWIRVVNSLVRKLERYCGWEGQGRETIGVYRSLMFICRSSCLTSLRKKQLSNFSMTTYTV